LIPKFDDFDLEGCEEMRVPVKYFNALKENLKTAVSLLKGMYNQA